jgi:hypothetical protein
VDAKSIKSASVSVSAQVSFFLILTRRDSVLDMVSRLLAGKSGVRLLVGARNIYLLQKRAIRFWVLLCLLNYRNRGLFSRNSNEAGVSLTTDLYQELSVGIRRVTPLSLHVSSYLLQEQLLLFNFIDKPDLWCHWTKFDPWKLSWFSEPCLEDVTRKLIIFRTKNWYLCI